MEASRDFLGVALTRTPGSETWPAMLLANRRRCARMQPGGSIPTFTSSIGTFGNAFPSVTARHAPGAICCRPTPSSRMEASHRRYRWHFPFRPSSTICGTNDRHDGAVLMDLHNGKSARPSASRPPRRLPLHFRSRVPVSRSRRAVTSRSAGARRTHLGDATHPKRGRFVPLLPGSPVTPQLAAVLQLSRRCLFTPFWDKATIVTTPGSRGWRPSGRHFVRSCRQG